MAEQAGLSVEALKTLERGTRRWPRPSTARKLADALTLSDVERVAFMRAAGDRTGADTIPDTGQLPVYLTRFMGRTEEVRAVTGLLSSPDTRFVTLTGPGGVGKTRLAVEAARTVSSTFTDGAAFVSLASLTDPALVASAIAAGLQIERGQEIEPSDALVRYFHEKQMLLVVDNVEQVLEGMQAIVHLLTVCPGLKALVTSRAVLHLSGEHTYAVLPLSVPDPDRLPPLSRLSEYDAVALFTARARAAVPEFDITQENARAVAGICRWLDGLPLALELAAVRIRLFPPSALLEHLSSRINILTDGNRDQPRRQQTLRESIGWSYSLLSPTEKMLFARLSVFSGGCTLDAAERICDPVGDLGSMQGIASLVDQSLVRSEGETSPRLVMLETVREYAAEKLAEREDIHQTRDAHAQIYLQLAEEAGRDLMGPRQDMWLTRLDAEIHNMRVALAWLLESGQAENALRLATGLRSYWHYRDWSEARYWIDRALTVDGHVDASVRARALIMAGRTASAQADFRRADSALEEALRLFDALGDDGRRADALTSLGENAAQQGEYTRGAALYLQGLTLARQAGDRLLMARTLIRLGEVALEQGKHAEAKAYSSEGLALSRALGVKSATAIALGSLGAAELSEGNTEKALEALHEALALRHEIGSQNIISTLGYLGRAAREMGEIELAGERFREALETAWKMQDRGSILALLGDLAELAAVEGSLERAARLGGAESALREALHIPLSPPEQARHGAVIRRAADTAGILWAAAWEEGRAMDLESAVRSALASSNGMTMLAPELVYAPPSPYTVEQPTDRENLSEPRADHGGTGL